MPGAPGLASRTRFPAEGARLSAAGSAVAVVVFLVAITRLASFSDAADPSPAASQPRASAERATHDPRRRRPAPDRPGPARRGPCASEMGQSVPMSPPPRPTPATIDPAIPSSLVPDAPAADSPPEAVIAATRRWLERAVIGLNLCPFAKAEHVHGRIRYAVSAACSRDELLADLERELLGLQAEDPGRVETTLLIHPQVLQDFYDYNDFLAEADDLLVALELDGILQIASFHPHYQFAGTRENDIGNFTNRSPFPTLHLLREASIDRAVQAFPEAEQIYERNLQTMEQLGPQGWHRLFHENTDANAGTDNQPRPHQR